MVLLFFELSQAKVLERKYEMPEKQQVTKNSELIGKIKGWALRSKIEVLKIGLP